MAYQKLLTKDLAAHIPALYSQENVEDPLVVAHFFSPFSGWDWYAYEGSPVDADGYYDTDQPKVDYLFFGLTAGHEDELGYFSLKELFEARKGALPLVERDQHWQVKPLSEVRAELARRREPEPEPEVPVLLLLSADRVSLAAREAALAMGETVGWSIMAGIEIGGDLADIPLLLFNQHRQVAGLPLLTPTQEIEYRGVFVRTLLDKRPQED